MTNEARSRAFYVDRLGFRVDWTHRFEPELPALLQVSRDGMTFYLSEHVMDSVRDIRKLVADMHQASHASVAATEEGTKLARETAAAAAKISDAVARQREGTSQVKTAIVEIVGAVNDSLTGSNDSTRNGESLLQLSHELKLAAKKFRVSGHDSTELGDELPG